MLTNMPQFEEKRSPEAQAVELTLNAVRGDFVARDKWAMKKVVGSDEPGTPDHKPSVKDREQAIARTTAESAKLLEDTRALIMSGDLKRGDVAAKVQLEKYRDQMLWLGTNKGPDTVRYEEKGWENAEKSYDAHAKEVEMMLSAVEGQVNEGSMQQVSPDTAARIQRFVTMKEKIPATELEKLALELTRTVEHMKADRGKVGPAVDEKSLRTLRPEEREERMGAYEKKFEIFRKTMDELKEVIQDAQKLSKG